LEVWYSLEKVPRSFAPDVLSYQTCSGFNNAPRYTETDLRNRPRTSAVAENASELPDAQGKNAGYTERCALDISFLGSAKTNAIHLAPGRLRG
jgi:hypothetical protein